MLKNNRDLQNFFLLGKISKNFGFSIAFKSFLDTIARRLPFKGLYHKTHKSRYGACKKYILKHYDAEIKEQIQKYSDYTAENLDKLDDQYNIWVFWWQGMDNAPELVKTCVESIRIWAGNRNVVVVSENNYKEYVEMPEFMYQKLADGSVSFAHFSDVLRLMLLAKYGGVWVDSTLLMTGDYLKSLEGYSFYTVKHKTDEGWHISDGSWATFFLACTPNDPVISFCRDMLLAYWKRENCLLCYLVFDCFLSVGYDMIPIIKKEIDAVPVNNSGVFDILYKQRHDIADDNRLQEVLNRAYIHKLTYKQKYLERINHQTTLYGKLKAAALKTDICSVKRTVAIVSGRLEGGGAERAASNLSITLSEKYNVVLILFSGENITYPYKGTLVDLHEPRKYGKIKKILLSFKRIRKLKKIKKQYNVDCTISLLPAPNAFNCLTRQKDKIITSYRNYMSAARNGKFDKKLAKYVDTHSDKIVSLSKMTEIDLIKAFGVNPDNIMTIYNACDPQLIYELAMKEKYETPDFDYIITTGRLMKQKGQWHLIKAFSEVHQKLPDLHLIILGEGELEDSLKIITDKLDLKEYIHFMGYVKSPHKYMYAAKAFVFPSLFEGLGNVLLEALACGLPVISTDCLAGPREILSSHFSEDSYVNRLTQIDYADYGILVPTFSMDDCDENNIILEKEETILADAIVKLIQNDDLQLKYRAAAKKRIQDFAPQIINNQWIDLIESLIMEENIKS